MTSFLLLYSGAGKMWGSLPEICRLEHYKTNEAFVQVVFVVAGGRKNIFCLLMDDFLFTEASTDPGTAPLLMKIIIERAAGLKVGKLNIEPQKTLNGVKYMHMQEVIKYAVKAEVEEVEHEIKCEESRNCGLLFRKASVII